MDSSATTPGKARERLAQRLQSFLGTALFLVLACTLSLLQMTQTQMLAEDRVRLDRYLDGTVQKPFAFRVLVPQTIRFLEHITPASLEDALKFVGRWIGPPMVPENLPVRYHFLALILVSSLLAYGIVGRQLYLRLFPVTRCRWLIPAGFLAILFPIVLHRIGHIYDFTLLLFMAALLLAIASQRHAMYFGLFAIACFNKETTILATIAYASCFVDRLPPRRFAAALAAQLVMFLLIYVTLRCLYADNPGEGMNYWLRQQVQWFISDPRAFCFLAAVFIVGYHWREKPLMMRRSASMMVANLGLFVCGAAPGEWRNLYESIPLLTLFLLRDIELAMGLWGSNRAPGSDCKS
jgi:hypothetical protein